ncbi:MAG: hypothetical protein EAZ76_04395 [Nostocales cyanobacterium]|nr:MAG: hypothetical protein EAZ87_23840 [Nostocales cyanobacterium]TAF18770.1 MAG: hypothetical protein EAZ76_04395 [Nostocales cyanobacterium]
MTYQPEEDLQRRLQQLEAEINSFSSSQSQKIEENSANEGKFNKINSLLERGKIWFQSLSGVKKLVATGVLILLALSVLQTVFKLVTSVISLALLSGLVYLGYKFFVSNSFQRKQ